MCVSCGVTRAWTKHFHWTFLVMTNTHFNCLQIPGWTSLAAHFEHPLLTVSFFIFFFFVLKAYWNVFPHFTFNRPNFGKQDRTEYVFSCLGDFVPTHLCLCVFFYYYLFLFLLLCLDPAPLCKAASVRRGQKKEGITGTKNLKAAPRQL